MGKNLHEESAATSYIAFSNRLANAELQGLRLISETLESYDSNNEEGFAIIISTVLNTRYQPNELAEEFKVSTGTISRWRQGKSCPPTYARGSIVLRLCEMLAKDINEQSLRLQVV